MSEPQTKYQGIEGVRGREPVGAVLTIGRKGPSGAPTDTDRFWIVSPQEDENRVRPLHPQFRAFNEADPAKRKSIRGNLVHVDRAECFEYRLTAQVLGKTWRQFPGQHPNRRPICSGDGVRATRLYGIGEDGSEDWREIDCPHDRCEYRQGDRKACKPFGRFLFRPSWPQGVNFPTPLVKLTTHSWNSISAFKGFFDYIDAQARNLGLDLYNLFGLPFTLTLERKKQPSRERAFPVLTISPECDLIWFFGEQRRRLAEAGSRGMKLLPVTVSSPEETTAEVLDADHRGIVPTAPASRPAETAIPGEPTQEEIEKAFSDVAPGQEGLFGGED